MSAVVSAGLRPHAALRLDAGRAAPREEWAIEETPVALLYNGLSFAVMMATPTDLEDFALGFALAEGIVEGPAEFALVDAVRGERGVALHAAIPQARFDALEGRRRNLEGRSGCGLCGAELLEAALRPLPGVAPGPRIAPALILAAFAALARAQPLNDRCGGAHAAAFVADDVLLVREDVGRHNAVDKAIGALHRAAPPMRPGDGLLAVTSRASYEIVAKAARAGVAVVATLSAPTDLAIRTAEAANLTLVAFVRDGRMNVYSGRERLV